MSEVISLIRYSFVVLVRFFVSSWRQARKLIAVGGSSFLTTKQEY
jgi:hypothetical protein